MMARKKIPKKKMPKHMTLDTIARVTQCLKDGQTPKEIANVEGITAQRVYRLEKRIRKDDPSPRPTRRRTGKTSQMSEAAEQRIIQYVEQFPTIVQWKLAALINDEFHWTCNQRTISRVLKRNGWIKVQVQQDPTSVAKGRWQRREPRPLWEKEILPCTGEHSPSVPVRFWLRKEAVDTAEETAASIQVNDPTKQFESKGMSDFLSKKVKPNYTFKRILPEYTLESMFLNLP